MDKPGRLVVIGGGAAGFFGAIQAKTLNPWLEVIILEAAPKCLGKVRISGGGRCNVTHSCDDVNRLVQFYPRGQRELKSVFTRFGPMDTVHWFESRNVKLKTEADGRMFPLSDDSQTIINCLLTQAQERGIEIHAKSPVKLLEKQDDSYIISTPEKSWEADKVLMAMGSDERGFQWLSRLGHTIIPPVPSLFTLNISDPLLSDLAGISFPHTSGRIEIEGHKAIQQEGALLITHWGLSGPVILRLSAWGARDLYESGYHARLVMDFCPRDTQDSLREKLLSQKALTPRKQVGNECPVDFPKRFWQRLLQLHEVPEELPWADVPQKPLNRLAESLKRYVFQVTGKGVFKDEFVTAGGVALKDIDMKTMESRHCKGLYFAGEVIDVDGLTGGFNFQNAWSTGWIAGEAIAHQ